MALQKIVQRALARGEVAPSVYGRADVAAFAQALRTCRNFTVLRGGGVANRAGTRYLGEAGDMTQPVTLYRWAFTAADQSTLLELGDNYLRFWRDGERLTVSGVAAYDPLASYDPGDVVTDSGTTYVCIAAAAPADAPPDTAFWHPLTNDVYELPTPWDSGAFNSPGMVRSSQDEFELTFTHPGYPPYVLRNGNVGAGNPKWSLELVVTAPAIDAPENPIATPGAVGTLNPVYVVTAVAATTYEESLPSVAATCLLADTPTEFAPNVITWDAVAGAVEYRVYKDPLGNGTYGYIGTATGQETFSDPDYQPDFLLTPPIDEQPFATSFNYPECCGYYQQRRVFAMTSNRPGGVWTSRTGHPNNFSIRSPLQDDDPVTFRLHAAELQVVRHIVPLAVLLLLTNTGEWVVLGDGDNGALTPSDINARQHGQCGASRAFPSVIANQLVFVQEGGKRVRVAQFDQQAQGLGSLDLSVLASHLFDDYQVIRTEYAKDDGIVWALRDDGVLLGLTYLPEDQTFGWHQHDTAGGVIEDICVVDSTLYLVVQREIDGTTVRYLEQLEARPLTFTNSSVVDDAFFVDCGITKDGASSVDVTGLDHLEGEEVYGLADGVPFGPFTVTSGAIALSTAASVVHVGLRITAVLESLDLDVPGTSLRARAKRLQALGLVLHTSGMRFYVGPASDKLLAYQAPSFQSSLKVQSGYVDMNVKAHFNEHGRFYLEHRDATPLTVLQLVPNIEVGG